MPKDEKKSIARYQDQKPINFNNQIDYTHDIINMESFFRHPNPQNREEFERMLRKSHMTVHKRMDGSTSINVAPNFGWNHFRNLRKTTLSPDLSIEGLDEKSIRQIVDKTIFFYNTTAKFQRESGSKVNEQHLVPKIYFKQFSYKNERGTHIASVCNTDTGEVLLVPEKTFCTAKINTRFYNDDFEFFLSITENNYGNFLKDMSDKRLSSITDLEKIQLSIFIAALAERFPWHSKEENLFKRIKNPDLFSERIRNTLSLTAADLLNRKWIWGRTSKGLVTNLNPLLNLTTLGVDWILNTDVRPRLGYAAFPIMYFPITSDTVLFFVTRNKEEIRVQTTQNSREATALRKLFLHSQDKDIFDIDSLDGVNNYATELNMLTLWGQINEIDTDIIYYNPQYLPYKVISESRYKKYFDHWHSRYRTAHKKEPNWSKLSRIQSNRDGFFTVDTIENNNHWEELKNALTR